MIQRRDWKLRLFLGHHHEIPFQQHTRLTELFSECHVKQWWWFIFWCLCARGRQWQCSGVRLGQMIGRVSTCIFKLRMPKRMRIVRVLLCNIRFSNSRFNSNILHGFFAANWEIIHCIRVTETNEESGLIRLRICGERPCVLFFLGTLTYAPPHRLDVDRLCCLASVTWSSGDGSFSGVCVLAGGSGNVQESVWDKWLVGYQHVYSSWGCQNGCALFAFCCAI